MREERRLPAFFPLIDKKKKCKAIATSFFSCFDEEGKQQPGERDAHAGEAVFDACKSQLASYTSCMVKQGADKNLRLIRAPQAYLDELAASNAKTAGAQ